MKGERQQERNSKNKKNAYMRMSETEIEKKQGVDGWKGYRMRIFQEW